MRKLLFTAGLLLAASSGEVMAHPHVWVTMKSSLVANASGQIAEVAVAWSFDEIYAQMALDGMDKDGDGTYSTEELKLLTEENISSLRGYDYFMHIKVDGKLQPVANVTKASQTYINNLLTLHFTIPLQNPVDPRSQSFELKVFDPEIYIAFDYANDSPVSLGGQLPTGCALDLKPIPTSDELEQTRTMLATKGKDWKPDPNEEFGSMFAQALQVACTQ